MDTTTKSAADLHNKVPPNWYYQSLKINKVQKFWHETRFKEVSKLIEKTDGDILDVGSADGVFSKVILSKSNANHVVGIDVLKSSVDWANKHWKKNKRLKFKIGNAHDLKFPDNHFSAVFALEVLEHVSKPLVVFREIRRVLKKDGYAIILVPSDSNLFKIIWFLVTRYTRGRIWNDCHVQSFNKKNRLAVNLKKIGFQVEVDRKFLLGMLNVVKVRKK